MNGYPPGNPLAPMRGVMWGLAFAAILWLVAAVVIGLADKKRVAA